GQPALEILRKAAKGDPETAVSRRAKMLVRMLLPHADQVWCNYVGPWDRWFSEVSYGVESLAFSPDSCHVASAGGLQGNVKLLWDTMTGKLIHRFKGSPYEWSVAFTKDGKQLISAGETVRWWDLQTGKEERTFQLKGFFRFWGLSP